MQKGTFDILCAEYCGIGYSTMLGKVYVLSQKDFDKCYNSDKKTPFDKDEFSKKHPGLVLFESNGCLSCHTLDGSALVGPSYKGIWKRKEKISINGK